MTRAEKAEAIAAEMALDLSLVGAYGISPSGAKYRVPPGSRPRRALNPTIGG
jgi:hypothetical protein